MTDDDLNPGRAHFRQTGTPLIVSRTAYKMLEEMGQDMRYYHVDGDIPVQRSSVWRSNDKS